MKNKISVGTLVFSLLLAILLTSMTTFVVTRESFVAQYRSEANGSDKSNEILSKLAELDKKFSSVYIGDTDYDTAEKYIMLAYLAGSGDKYAYYYTAEAVSYTHLTLPTKA